MKKLRFKTEQEFIKEHGENWRGKIGWNVDSMMDYLCGTEVPENVAEKLIKNEWCYTPCWRVRLSDTVPLEESIISSDIEEIDLASIFKEDPLTGFAPVKTTL